MTAPPSHLTPPKSVLQRNLTPEGQTLSPLAVVIGEDISRGSSHCCAPQPFYCWIVLETHELAPTNFFCAGGGFAGVANWVVALPFDVISA